MFGGRRSRRPRGTTPLNRSALDPCSTARAPARGGLLGGPQVGRMAGRPHRGGRKNSALGGPCRVLVDRERRIGLNGAQIGLKDEGREDVLGHRDGATAGVGRCQPARHHDVVADGHRCQEVTEIAGQSPPGPVARRSPSAVWHRRTEAGHWLVTSGMPLSDVANPTPSSKNHEPRGKARGSPSHRTRYGPSARRSARNPRGRRSRLVGRCQRPPSTAAPSTEQRPDHDRGGGHRGGQLAASRNWVAAKVQLEGHHSEGHGHRKERRRPVPGRSRAWAAGSAASHPGWTPRSPPSRPGPRPTCRDAQTQAPRAPDEQGQQAAAARKPQVRAPPPTGPVWKLRVAPSLEPAGRAQLDPEQRGPRSEHVGRPRQQEDRGDGGDHDGRSEGPHPAFPLSSQKGAEGQAQTDQHDQDEDGGDEGEEARAATRKPEAEEPGPGRCVRDNHGARRRSSGRGRRGARGRRRRRAGQLHRPPARAL